MLIYSHLSCFTHSLILSNKCIAYAAQQQPTTYLRSESALENSPYGLRE